MENQIDQQVDALHPLEVKLILSFQWVESQTNEELIKKGEFDAARLDMAVGWLQSKGFLAVESEEINMQISLTDTGEKYFHDTIPELRLINLIKEQESVRMQDVTTLLHLEKSEISSALGHLKDAKIASIGKGGALMLSSSYEIGKFKAIQKLIEFVKEKGIIGYKDLSDNAKAIVDSMHRKRGKGKGIFRITNKIIRKYLLSKTGRQVFEIISKKKFHPNEITQLTPELLKTGQWRGKKFRKYNINLRPPRTSIGKKHPYKEFLDSVKYKLVGLGFEEMRGSMVENEFWNMDVLYIPQFHPAREIHDVYFLKNPKSSKEIKEPFYSNVSATHKDGWKTGSKGWGYNFSKDQAKRLILRSQGTAVSARKLASKPAAPGKYFSIARCFRYEQVDATHATDFFQVEGIVISDKINFSSLLGLLTLFAKEVAKAVDIKFLPAYFPFTEPSVELHVLHPQLGWMELGGAGIFRPEVTQPLGIDKPVIAWGLGLDRMAMVALEIYDIRDLFSRDLDLIKSKRFSL